MSLTEAPVIIECPTCNAQVDAKVIATHEDVEEPDAALAGKNETVIDEGYPVDEEELADYRYRATLLVCVACRTPLLAYQENRGGKCWSMPRRVYPPDLSLPAQIPPDIRDSLEEAQRCLRAEAHMAAAVMCRRAVEGLCRSFGLGINAAGRTSLAAGLRGMRDRGVIDGMLLEWAEAVKVEGDASAHPDPATTTKRDATDLFDFALGICNYVFVLGVKFHRFKQRKDPGGQTVATVQ